MKKCSKCGIDKPLSDFYKQKATNDGHTYECKLCKNTTIKQWKKDNPKAHKIHQKRRDLKAKYNISIEQFNTMLKKQNNKCEICKNEFKNEKATHVDHCHKTGIIRSLLCVNCNFGLGFFKDSVENLKSAQKYLKKYSQKTK
jgi:hypothetical protein